MQKLWSDLAEWSLSFLPAATMPFMDDDDGGLISKRKGNDDLSLPKATVQKIITEILSHDQGMAFARETRDLLILQRIPEPFPTSRSGILSCLSRSRPR